MGAVADDGSLSARAEPSLDGDADVHGARSSQSLRRLTAPNGQLSDAVIRRTPADCRGCVVRSIRDISGSASELPPPPGSGRGCSDYASGWSGTSHPISGCTQTVALTSPAMWADDRAAAEQRTPTRHCMSPVRGMGARRGPSRPARRRCGSVHGRERFRTPNCISRCWKAVALAAPALWARSQPLPKHSSSSVRKGVPPLQSGGSRLQTWSGAHAANFFDSVDLEPLEPYPGSTSKPWKARHRSCGRTVAPRLGNVAQGQGPCRDCGLEATHRALRLDEVVATDVMAKAGLEPLAPFPGVDAPWRCRHLPCGAEVAPSYSNIKRGQGGCVQCAGQAAALRFRMPEKEATMVFVEAGLRPLDEYPGSSLLWRATHTCGGTVSPTLSNVRAGRGICRYCNSAFPFASEADGPVLDW